MEHYLIKHPFWIRLLDQIMPFWQKDDLPQIIHWATQTPSAKVIIFPVCYTTCPTHLTTATREILLSAISWQKQLPRARIVIGNYDILTGTEQRLKEELFREHGVDSSQVIWIPDPIGNSADEARKAAQAVAAQNYHLPSFSQ